MARPQKDEDTKRTAHLPRTRCTPSERAVIEAKAAQAGLSLSDYMRQMALCGHVIVREPLADIRLLAKLNTIGAELNAIGNNINQMARLGHIHGKIDGLRLAELSRGLHERLTRIDDFLTELGA